MIRRRTLRRVLLAVVILVLSTTVAVFIGYRRMTRDPEIVLDILKKEADMQLNKIRQTALKNGIREWHLEAASATVLEKKQMVLLEDPKVEFFMQDGDNVHLTADRGTIYTGTRRIDVEGSVSANNRSYHFQSDALSYAPDRRELHTDTPVTISGESFRLNADTMRLNLDTNTAHFDGGVEGVISEMVQF